jgi:hypothetical protein
MPGHQAGSRHKRNALLWRLKNAHTRRPSRYYRAMSDDELVALVASGKVVCKLIPGPTGGARDVPLFRVPKVGWGGEEKPYTVPVVRFLAALDKFSTPSGDRILQLRCLKDNPTTVHIAWSDAGWDWWQEFETVVTVGKRVRADAVRKGYTGDLLTPVR